MSNYATTMTANAGISQERVSLVDRVKCMLTGSEKGYADSYLAKASANLQENLATVDATTQANIQGYMKNGKLSVQGLDYVLEQGQGNLLVKNESQPATRLGRVAKYIANVMTAPVKTYFSTGLSDQEVGYVTQVLSRAREQRGHTRTLTSYVNQAQSGDMARTLHDAFAELGYAERDHIDRGFKLTKMQRAALTPAALIAAPLAASYLGVGAMTLGAAGYVAASLVGSQIVAKPAADLAGYVLKDKVSQEATQLGAGLAGLAAITMKSAAFGGPLALGVVGGALAANYGLRYAAAKMSKSADEGTRNNGSLLSKISDIAAIGIVPVAGLVGAFAPATAHAATLDDVVVNGYEVSTENGHTVVENNEGKIVFDNNITDVVIKGVQAGAITIEGGEFSISDDFTLNGIHDEDAWIYDGSGQAQHVDSWSTHSLDSNDLDINCECIFHGNRAAGFGDHEFGVAHDKMSTEDPNLYEVHMETREWVSNSTVVEGGTRVFADPITDGELNLSFRVQENSTGIVNWFTGSGIDHIDFYIDGDHVHREGWVPRNAEVTNGFDVSHLNPEEVHTVQVSVSDNDYLDSVNSGNSYSRALGFGDDTVVDFKFRVDHGADPVVPTDPSTPDPIVQPDPVQPSDDCPCRGQGQEQYHPLIGRQHTPQTNACNINTIDTSNDAPMMPYNDNVYRPVSDPIVIPGPGTTPTQPGPVVPGPQPVVPDPVQPGPQPVTPDPVVPGPVDPPVVPQMTLNDLSNVPMTGLGGDVYDINAQLTDETNALLVTMFGVDDPTDTTLDNPNGALAVADDLYGRYSDKEFDVVVAELGNRSSPEADLPYINSVVEDLKDEGYNPAYDVVDFSDAEAWTALESSGIANGGDTPINLLFNKEGNLVQHWYGNDSASEIENSVRALCAGRTPLPTAPAVSGLTIPNYTLSEVLSYGTLTELGSTGILDTIQDVGNNKPTVVNLISLDTEAEFNQAADSVYNFANAGNFNPADVNFVNIELDITPGEDYIDGGRFASDEGTPVVLATDDQLLSNFEGIFGMSDGDTTPTQLVFDKEGELEFAHVGVFENTLDDEFMVGVKTLVNDPNYDFDGHRAEHLYIAKPMEAPSPVAPTPDPVPGPLPAPVLAGLTTTDRAAVNHNGTMFLVGQDPIVGRYGFDPNNLVYTTSQDLNGTAVDIFAHSERNGAEFKVAFESCGCSSHDYASLTDHTVLGFEELTQPHIVKDSAGTDVEVRVLNDQTVVKVEDGSAIELNGLTTQENVDFVVVPTSNDDLFLVHINSRNQFEYYNKSQVEALLNPPSTT